MNYKISSNVTCKGNHVQEEHFWERCMLVWHKYGLHLLNDLTDSPEKTVCVPLASVFRMEENQWMSCISNRKNILYRNKMYFNPPQRWERRAKSLINPCQQGQNYLSPYSNKLSVHWHSWADVVCVSSVSTAPPTFITLFLSCLSFFSSLHVE